MVMMMVMMMRRRTSLGLMNEFGMNVFGMNDFGFFSKKGWIMEFGMNLVPKQLVLCRLLVLETSPNKNVLQTSGPTT